MSNNRVLVVDDEPIARDALKELLTSAGYTVDTASDGREALERINGDPPSLVVTDLRMPEITGMNLVQRLRQTAPGVPVVVITAHDGRYTGVDAFYRGAAGYLTKPLDFDELLMVIETALEPSN